MRLRVGKSVPWPECGLGAVLPQERSSRTRPGRTHAHRHVGGTVLPVLQNNSFPLTHLSIPSAAWAASSWKPLRLESPLPAQSAGHFAQVPGAPTTWDDRARPPRGFSAQLPAPGQCWSQPGPWPGSVLTPGLRTRCRLGARQAHHVIRMAAADPAGNSPHGEGLTGQL